MASFTKHDALCFCHVDTFINSGFVNYADVSDNNMMKTVF